MFYRHCFSTLILEYAIRKVQENQVGLKLICTQLLAYANYVNLLVDNLNTVEENKATLIDASKEDGLEVEAEKNSCIYCSFVTRIQGKIMT
jgi:hypothetical protein